jgi:hypothetical protein
MNAGAAAAPAVFAHDRNERHAGDRPIGIDGAPRNDH